MSDSKRLNINILPPIGSSSSTPLSEKIAYIRLYNLNGPEIYYLLEASQCPEPFEETEFHDYRIFLIEQHNNMKPTTIEFSDLPPSLVISCDFTPTKISDL